MPSYPRQSILELISASFVRLLRLGCLAKVAIDGGDINIMNG